VTTDAPRLLDIKPDSPRPLDELLAKALSRDRTQRFQSANEMLQALLEAERSIEAGRTLAAKRLLPRPALWLLAIGAISAATMFALPSTTKVHSTPRNPGTASPTVTIELRGVPEAAGVLVNGKPTSGNTIVLPDDGYSRLIEVQAPGMQPWRVMHPAGNNARYEVRMQPVQPVPPPQEALPAAIAGSDRAVVPQLPPSRDSRSRKHPEPTKRASPIRAPQTAKEREGEKAPPIWRDLDF
jgi:hypothetical protein